MKLSECKYGVLVISNFDKKVGMVVGVTESTKGLPAPEIKWQDGKTFYRFPENLSLYKD